MTLTFRLSALAAVVCALAGCAQPEREITRPNAPTSSRFSSVGKVTLHRGQPCTSQIMFDFRTTGKISTIWLGARMRESKVLTEAANRNRRVHIWGTWRQGPNGNCEYVNVTRVEPLSIAVVF